jgi:hypothetical protein
VLNVKIRVISEFLTWSVIMLMAVLTVLPFLKFHLLCDRLCGLVVGVLGCRSGVPGSIPGAAKKKKRLVGLERGLLGLVSAAEELLDGRVAAPV